MLEGGRSARAIAVYFILFYSVTALLLGIGIYLIGDRELRSQLDERIRVETGYLSESFAQGGIDRLRAVLRSRDDRGVNNMGYRLLDRQGNLVGGELRTDASPDGWSDISFRDPDGGRNRARALTVVLGEGYRLTVATELAPTILLRRTTTWLIAVVIAVMLAGGVGFGFLFSRSIRLRLVSINDTAVAITRGDMSQRIDVGLIDDEFGRLAVTLNHMLDRNERLIGNLRQVSSDIAHDLRTPLARLRQRLERALMLARVDPKVEGEIATAIEQSDAILSLFSALLRISEVESGSLRQYFKRFDIGAVAASLGESYAAVAEDGGRVLRCEIAEKVMVWGDRELLSQAMVNLLENALRHTPVGTEVLLRIESTRGGRARIAVIDGGVGVPDELLATLTRRFTRTDAARHSPGFGLGLNLVEAIVAIHDGQLALRNRIPGFEVCIDLPSG